MKKYFFLSILFILIVGSIGVVMQRKQPTQPNKTKLRVLTTFLPTYVFTVNVAGEFAEVINILPPGVGPHEYTFTPSDVQKIANADVIVMNGVHLEDWMEDLVKKSGTHAVIIDASTGIQTTDENPHIWLDPVRAETMVSNIMIGLAKADPKNAASYEKNAQRYTSALGALDTEFRQTLALTPDKQFIAFHPAFIYLAERYNLKQRAVIKESPEKEPSAQELSAIIDIIRKEHVRALFSEPQFSPTIVETVAKETGLTVRALDTAETGEFAPHTYEDIMRKNLEILKQALSEN